MVTKEVLSEQIGDTLVSVEIGFTHNHLISDAYIKVFFDMVAQGLIRMSTHLEKVPAPATPAETPKAEEPKPTDAPADPSAAPANPDAPATPVDAPAAA